MPQKPLDVSTPLFYPRAEEQQASLPGEQPRDANAPGYTKVFGFAPTWCTRKRLAAKQGAFLMLIYIGRIDT